MPLPRLNGVADPEGSPDYDRLFAGGLVTFILGVGFDENGANRSQDQRLLDGFRERGFIHDDHEARLLLRRAGRPEPRAEGPHYLAHAVTRDSAGRSVNAVFTLALAGDGSQGAETASNFLDGLHRCDVAGYGGHARYGTGPDFDYNFTADLVDERGEVVGSFANYKDLIEEITERGRAAGRSAHAEYRRLLDGGALVIHRVNDGNLVINLRNYHSGELGSYLMIDQLGKDPALRKLSSERFAERYRLWLLSGCRTHDYFYNLQTLNPSAQKGGLDLFGSRRLLYWSRTAPTLLALVDAVLARSTRRGILEALIAQNPPREDATGESHVALPWAGGGGEGYA
ncbi:MAG: hypothetical protein R3B09_16445 [Nannocystaceae bacterium]